MKNPRKLPGAAPSYGAVLCAVMAIMGTGFAGTGTETGMASWYGEGHRGRLMADGKPFDPDEFTAASWSYPLGTHVRVSLCSDAGKSVEAIITDRGPARHLLKQGRIIDLSEAAFKKLAPLEKGLVAIHVEVVKYPEAVKTETRPNDVGNRTGRNPVEGAQSWRRSLLPSP